MVLHGVAHRNRGLCGPRIRPGPVQPALKTTQRTTTMATSKKTAAPAAPAKKAAAKAVKAAAPVKAVKAAAAAPAKKVAAKAVKAVAPAKAPAVKAVKATAVALKPIKTAFSKTSLVAHLADTAAVDPKAAKAVMAALEATILASVSKKGLGEFTLPGLIKIAAQHVPAKKKRVGKDPFTGVERTFAAKPASTKIKARAMKKLKDAAL